MARTARKRATDVSVQRVTSTAAGAEMYARVNTIGIGGIRPFVLIPGIGVSSTYFERLAPNLNEFGPVHAIDLPGFGGVPHPEHAISIEQYADLVGKVIDDLGLDDPIIVGHSMGSQVATSLVSGRPKLTTLVLIGPVVNAAERTVLLAGRRFLQASWHEPFTVKALAIGAYLFCGFKWFSRVLPKMMSFPIEQHLPKVKAHTLVIRGEYDAVAPRDWVERVGELLPSSRLWEIPGAAHSVMYAHAEEVARLCVDHARRTIADGDDDTLRILDGTTASTSPASSPSLDDAEDANPPSLGQVARSVAGRVIETVGVITDDDEKIAEGKTATAEALEGDPS